MLDNNKNEETRLLTFAILSVAIIFGSSFFIKNKNSDTVQVKQEKSSVSVKEQNNILVENDDVKAKETIKNKKTVINGTSNHRIFVNTKHMSGSINLTGAVIDDITLHGYAESVTDKSSVGILNPMGTQNAGFVRIGWARVSGIDSKNMPNNNTIWTSDSKELVTGRPVELKFNNNAGQTFVISLVVDEDYMFKVDQYIINKSTQELELSPYISIVRSNAYPLAKSDSYVGPLGFLDGSFKEISYKKNIKNGSSYQNQSSSWIGISQKYWLVAGIPSDIFDASIVSKVNESKVDTRAMMKGRVLSVNPKETSGFYSTRLFVGPKNVALLDKYEATGINLLTRSIDLGMLYFITKPLLLLLKWLNKFFYNYGISIIIMTILIRIALYPLAKKSYESMEKMKLIGPQIKEIKEKYKDDRKSLESAMVAIYRKEGVNPLSTILPLILQIPVFFALYRVLTISIDLRHSVFIKGWINDLSAPDSTSFINLFGLLPFNAPSFLQIGVLPILMGITMWLQQRSGSSGQMSDEQQKIMKYLPLIFTIMLSGLPAGLMLYWISTNIMSVLQQYIISKSKK
ncbi:membrane protein insertase YidC [Rickettsiales bacterium]|nr:membrane protein insertase YidC [Rickettsiales bacterium]